MCPPYARQSIDKVSEDYSRQYEVVGESNCQDWSLYPWVDLDAVGEDFMVTCSNEEDLKLIEDSTVTMGQVAVMSLG
jgi:hypothetical protein